MNDQTLKNLLDEVDESVARPPIAADLRNRVVARVGRRRTARRAALTVLLVIALLPLLHTRNPKIPVATNRPTVAVTSPQTSPWDAVVERRTVAAILRMQDQRESVMSVPLDPLQRLRMESDATAATLLAAGDHYAKDPASARQGAENYQRVKTYFPKTPWADQADRRLSKIQS